MKPPLPMQIGLYDDAKLGPSGEQEIQSYINWAFRQAGIAPTWSTFRKGPAGQEVGPSGTSPVNLFVEPGAAKGAALPLSPDAGGYSVPGSDRATILAGTLAREASGSRLLPAQVMGLAAVHELGHALGLQHDSKGVMQPRWSPTNFQAIRTASPWSTAQRSALLAAAQKLLTPQPAPTGAAAAVAGPRK